jgi:hypothetical protein
MVGHLGALVPTLSAATLRSAWSEPDVGVRGAMWQALMLFLKGNFKTPLIKISSDVLDFKPIHRHGSSPPLLLMMTTTKTEKTRVQTRTMRMKMTNPVKLPNLSVLL